MYCSLIPVAGLRDWRFESLFSMNSQFQESLVSWYINLDSFLIFTDVKFLRVSTLLLVHCSQNVVLNKPLLVILVIGSEPSKYVLEHMARCIYVLVRKRIAFPMNMHLDRKDGNDILKHVPSQDG